MCSLPGSSLHLAKDCGHWEIDRIREDAFQQFYLIMKEWQGNRQGNKVPKSWAEAWPQMSRA